jgi:hypothetical protein
MWHNWDFLPEGSLRDSSGFLAVWVAQSLAADAAPGDGRCRGLPAWVVASGSPAGDGSGAAPAGFLRRKAEHLIEEGVRVLMVVDEDGVCGGPPRLSTARAEGVNRSGADDLLVVRCRGVEDALAFLRDRRWTWPVPAPAARRLLAPVEPARASVRSFRRARPSNYISPHFAVGAVHRALERLDGAGYLLAEAPAAWGKSALAAYLKTAPEAEDRFGTVVRYQVLHGLYETVASLIEQVCTQCPKLVDDETSLPVFSPGDVREVGDGRGRLAELLRQTMAAVGRGRRLLVIDGLDELTGTRGGTLHLLDVLPDPRALAAGCSVLLLARPERRPELDAALGRLRTSAARFGVLALGRDTPEYRAMMDRFAVARLGPPADPHLEKIRQ